MPPKAKKPEASKKTETKKKEKVIEDKTFGLKNKKGKKQQTFIKNVTNQVKFGNQSAKKMEELNKEKTALKDDKKKQAEELNALFKPVQVVSKGADPKSVVCAFYKQGQCKKGDKCKFSHDLSLERKGEKRSAYSDVRDDDQDTMDTWDEAKLEEVVNKKHGEKNQNMPTTSIICKFFLTAVEMSKYGWFWECPNGPNCHYRHALPPGFVLKKDEKKDDKKEEISLEELIERERAALGGNLTKVTLETFLKWKDRKRREKLAKFVDEKDKKRSEFKQGKMLGISGREMFEFNPDLVAGDDAEADDTRYEREVDEEEEGPVYEINFNSLSGMAREVDGSGTQRPPQSQKTNQAEALKLSEAAAVGDTDATQRTDAAIAAVLSATVNGDILADDMPIDENLFDDDDLDDLEDELETLDLEDQ